VTHWFYSYFFFLRWPTATSPLQELERSRPLGRLPLLYIHTAAYKLWHGFKELKESHKCNLGCLLHCKHFFLPSMDLFESPFCQFCLLDRVRPGLGGKQEGWAQEAREVKMLPRSCFGPLRVAISPDGFVRLPTYNGCRLVTFHLLQNLRSVTGIRECRPSEKHELLTGIPGGNASASSGVPRASGRTHCFQHIAQPSQARNSMGQLSCG
jgi:hypothetical protein